MGHKRTYTIVWKEYGKFPRGCGLPFTSHSYHGLSVGYCELINELIAAASDSLVCWRLSILLIIIYCKEGASCPLILNIPSHSTFHSVPFRIVCLEDVVCPSCLFSFSLYLMKDCSSKIDLSVFCRKKGKRLPNAGRSVGPGDKDKSEKGLRHFSMKVCEKVQQKRTTSYNEVQAKNVLSPYIFTNVPLSEGSPV